MRNKREVRGGRGHGNREDEIRYSIEVRCYHDLFMISFDPVHLFLLQFLLSSLKIIFTHIFTTSGFLYHH